MYVPASVSYAISDLLDRQPFVPFELVVADGRLVKVGATGQAWLKYDGDLLYVVSAKPDGQPFTEIIATAHVAVVRIAERLARE